MRLSSVAIHEAAHAIGAEIMEVMTLAASIVPSARTAAPPDVLLFLFAMRTRRTGCGKSMGGGRRSTGRRRFQQQSGCGLPAKGLGSEQQRAARSVRSVKSVVFLLSPLSSYNSLCT